MGVLNFIKHCVLDFIGGQRYLTVQFDITHKCNLQCNHCYVDIKQQTDLSLSQWKLIFDQYKELLQSLSLKPNIVLCGGEPLCSPNLENILQYFDQLFDSNVNICVLTNGTILPSNSVLKLFKKLKIVVSVSLDGDEISHDIIRGQGSYQKMLKGIHFYKNQGIKIVTQTVLTPLAVDNISSFFSLYKSFSLDEITFVRFIPIGRGKKSSFFNSDNNNLDLQKIFLKIIEAENYFKIQSEVRDPLFSILKPSTDNRLLGYAGFVIDACGNFKPSSRVPFYIGNVLTQHMSDLFLKHPTMLRLRNLSNIGLCEGCQHIKVCAGNRNAAYARFGDYFAHDPDCWIRQPSM